MSYEDIDMILDRIENPVLKQTTEHLFSALDKSETDEEYDMNKATLVMFLGSVAPELLNKKINVAGVLQKSAEVSEDLEKKVKQVLAENGIYYFGPLDLDKHLLTGPESQGPLPRDPHGRNQEPHGNRPGKREMIGDVATLRRMKPELDLPRRVEMLQMSHEDLLRLHQSLFGMTTTGSGKYIRNVETDPKSHRFRRREVESEGEAYHMRGRGQGKNSTDEMRVQRIKEIFSGGYVKPPKKVRVATSKPRVPGKDVVDYEELGAGRRNEQEQAHRSSTKGTKRSRSALGTLSRSRDVSDHPEHGEDSKVTDNTLAGKPALSAAERANIARQAASGVTPPAKGQAPKGPRIAPKPATVKPEPAPAEAAASAAAKPVKATKKPAKAVATAAKPATKPAQAAASAAKKPAKAVTSAAKKPAKATAAAAKKPAKAAATAAKKPASAAATAAKKPAKAAGKGAKATKKPLRRAAALAANPTKAVLRTKPAPKGSLKSAVKRIMDARSKLQGAAASGSNVKQVEQVATNFVSSLQHVADLMEQLEHETNPARIENIKMQLAEAQRDAITNENAAKAAGLGEVIGDARSRIGAGETIEAVFKSEESAKDIFLERLNKIREKNNGA